MYIVVHVQVVQPHMTLSLKERQKGLSQHFQPVSSLEVTQL